MFKELDKKVGELNVSRLLKYSSSNVEGVGTLDHLEDHYDIGRVSRKLWSKSIQRIRRTS